MGRARFAVPLVTCLVTALAPAAGADEGPAPSAPSPPPLSLSVAPGSGGAPWRLRVENTGDLPMRVVADPRLLTLELDRPPPDDESKARKGRRPEPSVLRCALPADARPTIDDGPIVVIPAKRSWSASFDPLFYCFGPRERAALVAGAVVKPRLGWAPPKTRAPRGAKSPAPSPPFAAVPVGAAVGQLSPVKELEGAAVTLTEDVAVAPPPAAGAIAPAASDADAGAEAPKEERDLVLSVPAAVDVARGSEIGTTVTLTNTGERAATLLFRPQTLMFKVTGPGGSVTCGSRAEVEAPIRELFVRLGPKGRAQLPVLLTSVCPSGTFDDPGVYRVLPRLDTTGASGRPLGMKTWDGETEAKEPLLVRVRSPRKPAAPTRPSLD